MCSFSVACYEENDEIMKVEDWREWGLVKCSECKVKGNEEGEW